MNAPPRPLTVGSLFAGIGGFDLGLERTGGFRTLWQCELDDFCRGVLEQHWPDAVHVADVRDVHARDLPAVDVIAGGFPCQDLSVAGTGEGLSGARSGLWREMLRVIGDFRPRYVLVENVSALLARGLGVVLGDLAALGYDAEWDCVPASAIGANHQRDRIWLIAYPNGEQLRDQPGRGSWASGPRAAQPGFDGPPRLVADADGTGLEVGGSLPGHSGPQRQAPVGGSPRDVADPDRLRLVGDGRMGGTRGRSGTADGGGDAADPERSRLEGVPGQAVDGSRLTACVPARGSHAPWAVEPGMGRLAYGLSQWVDGHWDAEPAIPRTAYGVPEGKARLRALGNALVPQIAELIGHCVLDYESQR